VLVGNPNDGVAVSEVGAADAAAPATEVVGADVGVLPNALLPAVGFVPNSGALEVAVPENNELVLGSVDSPFFGVPNKLVVEVLEAWPLSVGGGPAGVVEKLNVFVGAGVVDPAGADVEAAFAEDVPKLSGDGLLGYERLG
jgi:hypothetical protein